MIQETSHLAEWEEGDVAIAERLIRAYKATMSQENTFPEPDDLWSRISGESRIDELRKLLGDENAEELSRYLVSHWNSPVWFGGIGTADNHSFGTNPEKMVFDEFLRLIEFLGLDANPDNDSNDMIDKVSEVMGLDCIIPPPVVSAKGLATRYGVMHYLHPHALYLANKIKSLTNANHKICEYGGGFGLNMFFLYKMGRKNGYLFDLPFVNVISGFFLIKALGHDAVILEGEKGKSRHIHIRPFWSCDQYSENFFEISANQNSFPEIDAEIVRRYFEVIQKNTHSYFLSINQEHEHAIIGSNKKHIAIPKMIAEFSKYELVSRNAYPIWDSYFEELYRISE